MGTAVSACFNLQVLQIVCGSLSDRLSHHRSASLSDASLVACLWGGVAATLDALGVGAHPCRDVVRVARREALATRRCVDRESPTPSPTALAASHNLCLHPRTESGDSRWTLGCLLNSKTDPLGMLDNCSRRRSPTGTALVQLLRWLGVVGHPGVPLRLRAGRESARRPQGELSVLSLSLRALCDAAHGATEHRIPLLRQGWLGGERSSGSGSSAGKEAA